MLHQSNQSVHQGTAKLTETMDWNTLYEFQKSFRSRKGISGASLLRLLKLSPNTLQFMYSKKIQPSIRIGSIGLELLQALERLRNSPEQQATLVDDSSLTEKINDVLLCEDNKERLKDARILDAVVFEEESRSVQIMCSGWYDEETVRKTLGDLTANLQLTIRGFETAHPLGFYEPSISITSNAKGSLTGTGCHNEYGRQAYVAGSFSR